MELRIQQAVRPNVDVVRISGLVLYEDREEIQKKFDKLTGTGCHKAMVVIKDIKGWGDPVISTLFFATGYYRTVYHGQLHLVVTEHQRSVLRQMHFDNKDGLGTCFETEQEALKAFDDPPRLAHTG